MKFLGSSNKIDKSSIVIVGIPFDATSSFKSGSRFAPDSIRLYSDVLETYSPYLDGDLEDIKFFDYGNINVTINNFDILSEAIRKTFSKLIENNKKVIAVGGEHLISYPVVKTYKKFYNNFKIVHIDAHADLRDSYLGEKFSHATVMRRVSEIIGPENIFQFGVRSGTKEEFNFANENTNFYPFNLKGFETAYKYLKNEKIYLTIDIDVLDPSILPGTGTPEPGGIDFNELIDFLKKIYNLDIIGADIVELLPQNDISGVSSIVAAKILRELLIIIN